MFVGVELEADYLGVVGGVAADGLLDNYSSVNATALAGELIQAIAEAGFGLRDRGDEARVYAEGE